MDELVKDLTLDMISEGLYRMIAEAIGTDNFYKLAEIVGGTTIYIPKPEPHPPRPRRPHQEGVHRLQPPGTRPEVRRHREMGSAHLRPRASGRADRDLRLPGRPRGRIRGRGAL